MKNLIFAFLLTLQPYFASSAIVILNGLTHIHSLDGGQKISGKIVVRNQSNKPARLLVYKQDIIANCSSSISYVDSASMPYSLSPYLTTSIDEKVLAPNEDYTLFYNIDVPKEKLADASYWSVLMLEGADPIQEVQPNGVNVNSIVRYAIQIIGDYGKFESPKLNFEDIKIITNVDSIKVITMRIKNDGLFTTSAKVMLELYNPSGEKVKVLHAIRKRIYPSSCIDFEIELNQLDKGIYDGIIIADNGKDLFGANVSVDID